MVKIIFFGILKSLLKQDQIDLELDEERNIGDLINRLKQEYQNFENIYKDRQIVIAVNQEIADEDTTIKPGDEIAFLPPVSGG